ncbi:hypothetical protein [Microcoleus sp. B13-B6]
MSTTKPDFADLILNQWKIPDLVRKNAEILGKATIKTKGIAQIDYQYRDYITSDKITPFVQILNQMSLGKTLSKTITAEAQGSVHSQLNITAVKDANFADDANKWSSDKFQELTYKTVNLLDLDMEVKKENTVQAQQIDAQGNIGNTSTWSEKTLVLNGCDRIGTTVVKTTKLPIEVNGKKQTATVHAWCAMTMNGHHIFHGVVEKAVLIMPGEGIFFLYFGYGGSGIEFIEWVNEKLGAMLWQYTAKEIYYTWKKAQTPVAWLLIGGDLTSETWMVDGPEPLTEEQRELLDHAILKTVLQKGATLRPYYTAKKYE